MSNTNLTAVAQVLSRMHECLDGRNDPAFGICGTMQPPALALFYQIAEGWPYHSKRGDFPIPSLFPDECPSGSYFRCREAESLWQGPCRTLRRDLCAYVLTYLTDPEYIAASFWRSEAVEHILHTVEIDYV